MLTVYKASAGSGKTFTLAYEYIKLVLGVKDKFTGEYRLNKDAHEAHRSILAITFTNKATDEMKRRIVKELAILARVPSTIKELAKDKKCQVDEIKSDYTDRLVALFKCSEAELEEAADKALNQLLFDYTFFNISTIDAFFQTVLRTFAYEVDLVGNYEVEIDDTYAISTGVNEMLHAINYRNDTQSKQLALWLKRYMMQKLNDGQGFNLFNRNSSLHNEILKFVTSMCDENFKLNAEHIINYLEDQNRIALFEEKLVEKLSKIKNTIKQNGNACLDALKAEQIPLDGAINRYVIDTIKAWAGGKPKEPSATVLNIIVENKPLFNVTYTKKNAVPAGLTDVVVANMSQVVPLLGELKMIAVVRSNLYALGLFGDVLRFVRDFRKENNLILLSDTNDLLRRIISEDETPFIYERVGVRLHNFLIDEFQDTSKLQWKNLSPLVAESLSNNNDNLIIGDEKQCIYRFRNSDPSLLREEVMREFPTNYTERGIDITDNTNWRSSADVVRFNNTIFMALSQLLGVEDIYRNTTQLIAPKHVAHHGYVKFTRVNNKDVDFDEQSLSMMFQDIKRQLDSGYRPSDIAVLVNRRKEAAKVAKYLLDNLANDSKYSGVEIVSDEALRIDSSPMVRLIISVLRIIDIPEEASTKSVRRGSAREIVRVQNRYEYLVNSGFDASEALLKALGQTTAVEELAQKIVDMKCVNLPSIVERIIDNFVHADALHRENVFLSAFQDIVVDYYALGNGDLHSFLRWWDKSGSSACLQSSDLDAIKIMTIHKSKGLEFKCVHIPFANWEMTTEKDLEWFANPSFPEFPSEIVPPLLPLKSSKKLLGTQFETQYLENRRAEIVDVLNMTYVAFTRAVDELSVTYSCPDSYDPDKKVKIGSCINEAFSFANKRFCDDCLSRLSAVESACDIYVYLSDINNNGSIEIGTPTTATKEMSTKKDEKLPMPDYYSNDGEKIWNQVSIEDICDTNEARERGIFLHNVMSRIRRPEDISTAVRRQAYRQFLSEGQICETIAYVEKIISDKRVDRWFNGYERIICERPVLRHNQKDIRPDRVVWTADGTVEVVDYKFGDEHPVEYSVQVEKYMKALTDAGYAQVKGFLWYPDSEVIIEIKTKEF